MVKPLSAQEAIKQAAQEEEEESITPLFGFFNFDGDSLGEDVAHAFITKGLLNEDGTPTSNLTQFFQQDQPRKEFENRTIRQLIIANFIKELVVERLVNIESLPILDNYPIFIQGLGEQIANQINQLFAKEPIPVDDFLPPDYADQLAQKLKTITTNWLTDKLAFSRLLQFQLTNHYQDQITIAGVINKIITDINAALASIQITELVDCLSFYGEIKLAQNKLVIDLIHYNLETIPPQVKKIERYQLEVLTIADKLAEYQQIVQDLGKVLQTAVNLNDKT